MSVAAAASGYARARDWRLAAARLSGCARAPTEVCIARLLEVRLVLGLLRHQDLQVLLVGEGLAVLRGEVLALDARVLRLLRHDHLQPLLVLGQLLLVGVDAVVALGRVERIELELGGVLAAALLDLGALGRVLVGLPLARHLRRDRRLLRALRAEDDRLLADLAAEDLGLLVVHLLAVRLLLELAALLGGPVGEPLVAEDLLLLLLQVEQRQPLLDLIRARRLARFGDVDRVGVAQRVAAEPPLALELLVDEGLALGLALVAQLARARLHSHAPLLGRLVERVDLLLERSLLAQKHVGEALAADGERGLVLRADGVVPPLDGALFQLCIRSLLPVRCGANDEIRIDRLHHHRARVLGLAALAQRVIGQVLGLNPKLLALGAGAGMACVHGVRAEIRRAWASGRTHGCTEAPACGWRVEIELTILVGSYKALNM
jgi:hypothetical protein